MSSSPRLLGSTANAITGAGSFSRGIAIGSSRAASQSPARVSFSLATAPISPGPNSLTCSTSLPANTSSWPILSLTWARVFSTWLSARITP